MKFSLLPVLFLLWLVPMTAGAQISGIINDYVPVTGLLCDGVTVTNTTAFAVGDRVIVIQMKGAQADLTNTSAFGTITNYQDCGHYEFAEIASISGNTVRFVHLLLNSYTVSGLVQLVRVPQYTNVTVSGTLLPQDWNGTTGGVLALEVSGTLTLGSNTISATGTGFRGSFLCNNPDGGCGSGYTDYSYVVSSGYGAEKGEGICQPATLNEGGRGALGNGGGGGNKHNSGGGGGSNGAAGGNGGDMASFCPPMVIGGIGGKPLDYTLGRIFPGGGGGAPDHNNGVGTSGTDGGGIVIVRAATLVSANGLIESNGEDVGSLFNNIGDGAGGAGAGGTILLDVQNFTGNVMLHANGGNGGDQNTNYGACFGPGGGGGGGAVLNANSSWPFNVGMQMLPGNAGTDINPNSPCYQQSFGATPGAPGMPVQFSFVIPESQLLPPSVDLGPDVSNCDTTITLNALIPGAVSYEWSNGLQTPSINVTTQGTYWVEVTTTASCTVTDTFVFSTLTLDLGPDLLLCALPATLTATTDATSILWSTGEPTAAITVTAVGTYWATASTANCTASDTMRVEVLDLDIGPDVTACDTILFPDATLNGGTYAWSTGSTSPSITITAPGVYWVDVTVNGCTIRDTLVYTQTDLLHASFSAVPDLLPADNTLSQMINTSTGGLVYYWNFGDGSPLAEGLSPEHTFPQGSGTYLVTLIATDAMGCIDSAYRIVSVESALLFYVPNTFTPNGDEFNTVFQPVFTSGFDPEDFNLQIYDRWGLPVFETNRSDAGWDGTYLGFPAPDGIYTWIITFGKDDTEERVVIHGHVVLVR